MYGVHVLKQSPQKFENEPSLTKTSSKICCNPTYIVFVFCRNGSSIFFKQLCTGKSLPSPFLAGPFRPFGTALRKKGLDLGSSVVVKTAEISTWASSWKPMPAPATMSSKLPESSRRCGACGARHRNRRVQMISTMAGFREEKRYDMICLMMEIWWKLVWQVFFLEFFCFFFGGVKLCFEQKNMSLRLIVGLTFWYTSPFFSDIRLAVRAKNHWLQTR